MTSLFRLCVIRHKATGELMPLMRRGKGYSHWNPSNPDSKPSQRMHVPRVLKSRKQANACIHAWFNNPNARYGGYTNSYGEDDYDVITNDDGRKIEDLEIVEVDLVEVDSVQDKRLF